MNVRNIFFIYLVTRIYSLQNCRLLTNAAGMIWVDRASKEMLHQGGGEPATSTAGHRTTRKDCFLFIVQRTITLKHTFPSHFAAQCNQEKKVILEQFEENFSWRLKEKQQHTEKD